MNEFIRKEIKELADTILQQSHILLAYEQGAPQIEVDIIKGNIIKLYEQLDNIVDIKWQVNNNDLADTVKDTIDNQVDELLNMAEVQFEGNLEQISRQIEEQEDVIEQQNETTIEEIELLKDVVEPSEITNSEIADKTEDSIVETALNDLVTDEKQKNENGEKNEKTAKANDQKSIGEVEDKSVSPQLQKNPIKSLSSAIGINDKFQFINELFDGSMQIYNKAINQIEQANDRSQAIEIFRSIASDGNWDQEAPAYLQLLDYVDRRFL